MTINEKREDGKLTLELEGRLDTLTAPELERVIDTILEEVTELVMDFRELNYISSAGLRVILAAEKKMRIQGKMTICNVEPHIMEVFTMTGFSDIITIV